MKYAVIAIVALLSSAAFASNYATGTSSVSEVNNGGKTQYTVSISGASAEALYKGLNVQEIPMSDEHGGQPYGAYKTGKNISCYINYGSYSCDLFVDAAGQLASH